MKRIIIKYVKSARMWVKSTFTIDEKSGKEAQVQEWFEKEPKA